MGTVRLSQYSTFGSQGWFAAEDDKWRYCKEFVIGVAASDEAVVYGDRSERVVQYIAPRLSRKDWNNQSRTIPSKTTAWQATECIVQPYVHIFIASVNNSVYSEVRVHNWTDVFIDTERDSYALRPTSYYEAIGQYNLQFDWGRRSYYTFWEFLDAVFHGHFLRTMDGQQYVTTSDKEIYAKLDILEALSTGDIVGCKHGLEARMECTMGKFAAAINKSFRDSMTTEKVKITNPAPNIVRGKVRKSVTHVAVRWQWLALPCLAWVGGAVTLAGTLWKTWRRRISMWRNNIMPLVEVMHNGVWIRYRLLFATHAGRVTFTPIRYAAAVIFSLLGVASLASPNPSVVKIQAGGKEYPGFDLDNDDNKDHKATVAWKTKSSWVQDVRSPDIICNQASEPGSLSAEVSAGSTVKVTWGDLKNGDGGAIVSYMANCNGDCSQVKPISLRFSKIAEAGVLVHAGVKVADDYWASDKLQDQGNNWDIIIPSDLKAGNYVLRQEMIFPPQWLGSFDPRSYPQCFNLNVTGCGSKQPRGTPGTELYKPDEKSFHWNLWDVMSGEEYPIPGPKLYNAPKRSVRKAARDKDPTADVATGTSYSSFPSSTTTILTDTTSTACPNTFSSSASSSTIPSTSDSTLTSTTTATVTSTSTSTSTSTLTTPSSPFTACSNTYAAASSSPTPSPSPASTLATSPGSSFIACPNTYTGSASSATPSPTSAQTTTPPTGFLTAVFTETFTLTFTKD
ncbi:glycosyl hydrolase family 61-domain-containing protein [Aspergillus multicolor]|uniref:lytic polysaccharide monooxygenase auxiliary activity family 9 protein n=1 Tax=Aspergillus multicolor TaxID=41759 RepID=UPI003CCDAA40